MTPAPPPTFWGSPETVSLVQLKPLLSITNQCAWGSTPLHPVPCWAQSWDQRGLCMSCWGPTHITGRGRPEWALVDLEHSPHSGGGTEDRSHSPGTQNSVCAASQMVWVTTERDNTPHPCDPQRCLLSLQVPRDPSQPWHLNTRGTGDCGQEGHRFAITPDPCSGPWGGGAHCTGPGRGWAAVQPLPRLRAGAPRPPSAQPGPVASAWSLCKACGAAVMGRPAGKAGSFACTHLGDQSAHT